MERTWLEDKFLLRRLIRSEGVADVYEGVCHEGSRHAVVILKPAHLDDPAVLDSWSRYWAEDHPIWSPERPPREVAVDSASRRPFAALADFPAETMLDRLREPGLRPVESDVRLGVALLRTLAEHEQAGRPPCGTVVPTLLWVDESQGVELDRPGWWCVEKHAVRKGAAVFGDSRLLAPESRALGHGHTWPSEQYSAAYLISRLVAGRAMPPWRDDFDRWVSRALEHPPERRFPSLADALSGLEAILRTVAVDDAAVELAPAPHGDARRRTIAEIPDLARTVLLDVEPRDTVKTSNTSGPRFTPRGTRVDEGQDQVAVVTPTHDRGGRRP